MGSIFFSCCPVSFAAACNSNVLIGREPISGGPRRWDQTRVTAFPARGCETGLTCGHQRKPREGTGSAAATHHLYCFCSSRRDIRASETPDGNSTIAAVELWRTKRLIPLHFDTPLVLNLIQIRRRYTLSYIQPSLRLFAREVFGVPLCWRRGKRLDFSHLDQD